MGRMPNRCRLRRCVIDAGHPPGRLTGTPLSGRPCVGPVCGRLIRAPYGRLIRAPCGRLIRAPTQGRPLIRNGGPRGLFGPLIRAPAARGACPAALSTEFAWSLSCCTLRVCPAALSQSLSCRALRVCPAALSQSLSCRTLSEFVLPRSPRLTESPRALRRVSDPPPPPPRRRQGP